MAPMRNDSSRRARFTQWLILAMFAAVLAGCFQTAGSGIEPTVADLTSIATVQGQPTPTFPPFITPIPTGGAFVPPADDPLITPSPTTDPVRLVTPTQRGAPGGAVPTRTSISIFGPTPTQNTGMLVPPTQIPGLSASPTQNPGVLPPPTQNPGVLPPPTVAPGVPPNPTPQGLLPTPTALPTDPPCLHTVQPGEWFYSIARKYNLNPADLIAANPHFPRPDQLQPGDVLNIRTVSSLTNRRYSRLRLSYRLVPHQLQGLSMPR